MISAARIEEACVLVTLRGGEPDARSLRSTVLGIDSLPLAGDEIRRVRLMVEEVIAFLLDRPATDFHLSRWAWSGRSTWRLFCSSGQPLREGEAREVERALRLVVPTVSAEAMLSVDCVWEDQAPFGVNRRYTGDAPI